MPTKFLATLLTVTSLAFAAGQTRTTISVSAVVRPAAKIEIQSPNAVTVFATLYANAEALVWTAADACSAPNNPQVIGTSGVHHLTFNGEELRGKNLVCLASSDGVLHASARLPQ